MKSKAILFVAVMAFATACKKEEVAAPAAKSEASVKAAWTSSDRWGTWNNGGYTVYNNVWGSGHGYQSIWANSYSQWGVWSDQPNTTGVKSYPNSTKYINRTYSNLSSVRSSFNATTPAGGAWASTYDIWAGAGNKYETMLWMNYTNNADGSGNIKPISYNYNQYGNAVPTHRSVSVGGHTWNVFRGWNGSATVFSFLRTSKTNGGTIDILAIQRWIQARGWTGNETLNSVQYGFEITTTNGGQNFTCNSYSVSFN